MKRKLTKLRPSFLETVLVSMLVSSSSAQVFADEPIAAPLSSIPFEERESWIMDLHNGSSSVVAISTEESTVYSGGFDGVIQSVHIKTGHPIRSWSGHSAPIQGMSYHSKLKALFTAGEDGRIIQWTKTGEPHQIFLTANQKSVLKNFHPDSDKGTHNSKSSATSQGWHARWRDIDDYILGEDYNQWDLRDGPAIDTFIEPPEVQKRRIHFPAITTIAIAGNNLITGDKNGVVKIWDIESGEVVFSRPLHEMPVSSIAVSNKKGVNLIATASEDASNFIIIDRWHVYPLPPPPEYAMTMDFSPDDNRLYGGGKWDELFYWESSGHWSEAGLVSFENTEHHGHIVSLKFGQLNNRSVLASISRQTDSSVILLDPQTGDTVHRLYRHTLCGRSLDFRNEAVATVSDDGTLRFIDLKKALNK